MQIVEICLNYIIQILANIINKIILAYIIINTNIK